ncbi:TetR family transcriptional regulator C-terminal domain-containing protein [Streptomyces sp. ATCC51928]|uniref:TetR/AcrR family transcriptional regulator n=1 Tax=Streptomyces caviscabies TaxID=90079 RepID=A0ABW2MKU1_9ACTN|nr:MULTISPECIES: TetR/AcrR family transcriptional regulator [unclassified Streptomyces]MDX3503985.1 TetR family transcriptional regulator C-terminal domain-containing protein [Streptomyces sp. ATCC51928]MDX5524812.1 TetR family transcriptional regulator C-terminal domain-containing protein [Streptomyces sp. DE06-01C]
MQQDEVAARVRQVIDAAGVSAREFARRIVIDPSKLSRSLNGTRRFTAAELARIADIGGVDVGLLIGAAGTADPAGGTAGGAASAVSPARSPSAPRPAPPSPEGGRPLQIVRETVRLIAERGFHAVRVADIAAACHTSTAAIHYHFPGRDELLEAAVRWCMDEDTRRRADATAGTRHAGDELRLLIELQTPRTEQQRRQWCVWLDLWAEAARSTTVGRLHVEYYRQWRGTVAEVIRRGVEQGVFRPVDVDGAALALTALIDGLASQVLATEPGSPGTGAQSMHDALIAHVDACLTAPDPSR